MRPEEDARLLRQFCRPADLSICVSSEKDYTFYEISTGSVRRDAAADVFLSEFTGSAAPRTDPRRAKGVWHIGEVCRHPTRRLELALLVHRDAWPECNFSLRAYDTAGCGLVQLPDPERDFDRLPVDATVVYSPADAAALRASPVPDYAEILRHLTAPLGWNLEEPGGRPAFRRIAGSRNLSTDLRSCSCGNSLTLGVNGRGIHMTQAEISGISPFFIVSDAPSALSFYRDRLGFDITFQEPADEPFFGIVRRGRAMIMLKGVGVHPMPNHKREAAARWDAYLSVPDPDALAAEFAARNVEFSEPLKDTHDGLRGFELKDADGYVLFFGRPR